MSIISNSLLLCSEEVAIDLEKYMKILKGGRHENFIYINCISIESLTDLLYNYLIYFFNEQCYMGEIRR